MSILQLILQVGSIQPTTLRTVYTLEARALSLSLSFPWVAVRELKLSYHNVGMW